MRSPEPAAASGEPRRAPVTVRLRAWLGSLPLQQRVGYLTTTAVALAVALAALGGWTSVRASLYAGVDTGLVGIATTLMVPVGQDISNLGGLTDRALRAGNVSVAAVRADGEVLYVPDDARPPRARC